MPRGSGKTRRAKSKVLFGEETARGKEPDISLTRLAAHLDARSVSVSLRYFRRECECFSAWTGEELKKFSSTLEKIRGYTAELLVTNTKLCAGHKGPPSEARFAFPSDVSEDQSIFEIKVDPSNKLRMHGFFVGQVFFLIWLDREHACFKE